MRFLVVDGANVVGSRPDGWWRDRPGAARRLHEQLSSAELPYDEVVLVLEGQGRRGAPAGRVGNVLTAHAPESGDEAIIKLLEERLMRDGPAEDRSEVVVVTADRALGALAEDLGARVVGPSWLLERL